MEVVPPSAKNLRLGHHPNWKNPPQLTFRPQQIFIPLSHQINNNFFCHNSIKASFLAVVIAPVTFSF